MRQFRTQKYWELPLDAYNNLLNALEKMYSSVDANLMEVEELKDIKEDERKELEKKWKEGKEYVIKARRLGRLLFSEATLQIVNIEDKFTEVNKGLKWRTYYERESIDPLV